MAGPSLKKRSREESGKKPGPRPSKRYKKQREYHSSDSEDVEHDAPPNLLGSDDEDIQDAVVDDGAPSSPQSASGSSSESGSAKSTRITKLTRPKARRREKTTEAPEPSRDSSAEEEDEDEDDGNDSLDDSDANGERPSRKSKRNDETAFATSIAKILTSSKLPRSKRADPIVARSAMSQAAGQQAADAALEAKARRRLRQEKRLALEKGRVRDVLVASTTRTLNMQTGAVEETLEEGGETTVDIMEMERRLRKVAQRGVVKLFNAVRASQVTAAEATKEAKREGRVSSNQKQEKVTQMSKKGFLDLIASGGGLRKGAIEEA